MTFKAPRSRGTQKGIGEPCSNTRQLAQISSSNRRQPRTPNCLFSTVDRLAKVKAHCEVGFVAGVR